MNKKFSTLVAALLVTGGSFAMVSQYAGSALAESPLAMAAAANLRATYSPVAVSAVAYADDVEGWKWTPEKTTETGDKFYLKNEGGSYLSYRAGGDGTLYIAADGAENYTKAEFKLDGNKNVQLADGTANLMVVGNALKTSGEGNKVTLFSAVDTRVTDTPLNETISYYLGENIQENVALGDEASTVTKAVEQGTQTLELETATAAVSSAAFSTIENGSTFVIENGHLKVVVPDNAAELWVSANADNEVEVVNEEPTNPGSVVTWSATGAIKLGTLYLEKGTSLELNPSSTGTKAFYLVAATKVVDGEVVAADLKEATVVVAPTQEEPDLPAGPHYLLSIQGGSTTSALQNATATAAAITFTPSCVAPSLANYSTAIGNIDAEQQWQVVPTEGGFYITDGIFYLTGDAAATTGTDVTMEQVPGNSDASVWRLDEDGAIRMKSAAVYFDGAQVKNATNIGENKTYLYAASAEDNNDYSTSLPVESAEEGTYLITTKEMQAAALNSDRVEVKIITSQDEAEPEDEPVGDWAFGDGKAFATGDKVTISLANGSSYLNVTEAGKLEGVAESAAQIWTVTVNNSGAGKTISFVNQYGQKLAFAATYDKATSAWKVDYSTSGKYSQFDVNAYGEIVFMVSEDANTTTGAPALNEMYELNIGATPAAAELIDATEAQNRFVKAVEKNVTTASAAVTLLNETYGAGNGFGILFKNMEITEDDVEDVTLESNPFSDAAMITAVTGPADLTSLRAGSSTSLDGKLFLKVSGSYPLTKEALDGKTNKEKSQAQVDAFRASEFIAVDTVRYSSLITDIDGDSKFYKYVKVKGSEMLSSKGYYYGGTYNANDFESNGDLAGVTRRIENAEFTVSQIQGGTASDPIQLTVSAIVPAVGNNLPNLQGHNTAAQNVKIAIKQFNNKYYLGAAAASAWPYIYVGMNNDVDYKTINGIVTLISRNYTTDGQVYATNDGGVIANILPKYVSTDKPEGQYVVTGGNYNRGAIVPFTFINRESGKQFRAVSHPNGVSLKKTDKADIYAVVGTTDTLEIKAAATGDEFVGYKNYSAKELANTSYVLKVVSNAAGIKDIYIAEDHNKDHSLGLNADTLESATFKLIKFEDAKSSAKAFGDTVRVSEKAYSYVYTKNGVDSYKADKKDNVVAFTYAIYNADNMEFLDVKGQGSTLENFFYCNPDKKYDVENAASAYKAQRFILKEKADGAIQLIPVAVNDRYEDKKWQNIFTDATAQGGAVKFTTYATAKLYAGLSDNKLHTEGTIYKIADNDLFRLVQVGAPMYRKLDGEVYDKVRIYKEGMQNIALFAQSADATILSGKNFLGMEHKADADLAKTMFSFMVDTAYVDRADNYKPEYLLAIDAEVVPEATYCPEHGLNPDCSHATKKIGYATGSYLVSLADSAAAWTASKAHNNPYMYDNHARLGFVKAAHIGDSLMIERGKAAKADTLNLKAGMTKASFALRIVDQDSKSFVMETKGGYIKWLNGVPVVVPTVAEAEVLNIEATENAATANEAIEAAGVQVIGGQGAVTVQGAAGKVITVANVLGQTIANQVAASDNVTIAAPAGVVVVAVDGDATKVVVK